MYIFWGIHSSCISFDLLSAISYHPVYPPPFLTARPKSSPSGSISDFWPSARSPASRLRTQRPTATAALSVPPHWLTPLISTSISDSAPEIEPQQLDFFILAISPSPTFRLRTQHPPPPPPPHPHRRTTAPPPPTRIHHHFRWRAREIESLWL